MIWIWISELVFAEYRTVSTLDETQTPIEESVGQTPLEDQGLGPGVRWSLLRLPIQAS